MNRATATIVITATVLLILGGSCALTLWGFAHLAERGLAKDRAARERSIRSKIAYIGNESNPAEKIVEVCSSLSKGRLDEHARERCSSARRKIAEAAIAARLAAEKSEAEGRRQSTRVLDEYIKATTTRAGPLIVSYHVVGGTIYIQLNPSVWNAAPPSQQRQLMDLIAATNIWGEQGLTSGVFYVHRTQIGRISPSILDGYRFKPTLSSLK